MAQVVTSPESLAKGSDRIDTELQGMMRLRVGRLLGRGAYGSVYLAHHFVSRKKCVLKRVRFSEETTEEVDKVATEISIMQTFDHPNIVKCIDFFHDKPGGMLCLVMEFCSRGDLHDCIQRQNGQHFAEKDILVWFHQMLLGLDYIHKNKVIHRDIKTKNIFLTKLNIVKIGDFGCSRVLKTMELAKTFVGTPCYMAPELGSGKPYDFKTDVWALGCVLYELASLKPPFNAQNIYLLSKAIRKGIYDPIPSHYSSDLQGLVNSMISVDQDARPSIEKILTMKFINKTLADVYTSLISQAQRNLGIEESAEFSGVFVSEDKGKPIDLLESVNAMMQTMADRKIQEIDQKIGEENAKLEQIMQKEDFRQSIVIPAYNKVVELEKSLPPLPLVDMDAARDIPTPDIPVTDYPAQEHIEVPLSTKSDGSQPSTNGLCEYSEIESPFSNQSDSVIISPQPPPARPGRTSPRPKNMSRMRPSPPPTPPPPAITGQTPLFRNAPITSISARRYLKKQFDEEPKQPEVQLPVLEEPELSQPFLDVEYLESEREEVICAQKLIGNCLEKLIHHQLDPIPESPTETQIANTEFLQDIEETPRKQSIPNEGHITSDPSEFKTPSSRPCEVEPSTPIPHNTNDLTSSTVSKSKSLDFFHENLIEEEQEAQNQAHILSMQRTPRPPSEPCPENPRRPNLSHPSTDPQEQRVIHTPVLRRASRSLSNGNPKPVMSSSQSQPTINQHEEYHEVISTKILEIHQIPRPDDSRTEGVRFPPIAARIPITHKHSQAVPRNHSPLIQRPDRERSQSTSHVIEASQHNPVIHRHAPRIKN